MSTKTRAASAGGKSTLTMLQERFVAEYLVDMDGAKAYVRAGGSTRGAKQSAYSLLRMPAVIDAIQLAQAASLKRTEITADAVLERWRQIAFADAREISEYRRSSCPKCWGGDRRHELIDPECRGCLGEGVGRVFIHDTRSLGKDAAALYAGVQVSKDGLKALTNDQLKALEVLTKYLGLLKEQVEHSGPNGQPIQSVIMNDDQFRVIAKTIADEV